MKKTIKLFLFITSLVLIISAVMCKDSKDDLTKSPTSKKRTLLPSSTSRLDEIVVVTEDELWQGDVGDTLRHFLMKDFGILPQREATFDLRHVRGSAFFGLLRRGSTILVAGVSDTENKTFDLIDNKLNRLEDLDKGRPNYFTINNVWAEPQQVVYIHAATEKELINMLIAKEEALIKQFYKIENKKANNNNYVSGVSEGLTKLMNTKFNLKFKVPENYLMALEKDNLVWLRFDNHAAEEVSNLLITTLPYGDENAKNGLENMNQSFAIATRDSMGANVQSDIKGARMVSYDNVLPYITDTLEWNTNRAITMKTYGLWKMKNDFMGGPFVNYLIDDRANKRLIAIDGFIYGPKHKKRPLVRKMEVLIERIKILKPKNNTKP